MPMHYFKVYMSWEMSAMNESYYGALPDGGFSSTIYIKAFEFWPWNFRSIATSFYFFNKSWLLKHNSNRNYNSDVLWNVCKENTLISYTLIRGKYNTRFMKMTDEEWWSCMISLYFGFTARCGVIHDHL